MIFVAIYANLSICIQYRLQGTMNISYREWTYLRLTATIEDVERDIGEYVGKLNMLVS